MATNTLGEFSDGEDDWVFEIDEGAWANLEDDNLIRSINEDEVLNQTHPTLGEWSDGDDDWVFEIDEGAWGNLEDDNLIRSINEDEVLNQTHPTLGEWSDGDDDWVFEIDEGAWADLEDDDDNDDSLILSVDEDEVLNQTGRGEKRKSDDQNEELGQDYYEIQTPRKRYSKKFGMTATDHIVRFNNGLHDVDLLESQERTHAIFHHLLEDVTTGMNPNDQVRFILRSDQLQTPIAIPFLPLEKLTTEKVLSHVEKVVQSNEEFRLNDTVTIDIIHVEMPQGSGKRRVKRNIVNIREYLKKKQSVVTIKNKDNFCLARALAVGIAKIEKDPRYGQIKDSRCYIQFERALGLHQAANVPLRSCGLNEVNLFQQYLTNYQIIVVFGDHNNSIIYPHEPPNTDEKPILSLYYHNNHFDTITSLPGFLNKSHFCHRCHKSYDNTTDHMCSTMCRLCRQFGCIYEGDGIVCNECDRVFKNQACYDHHKEPINGGGRSVCEVIRKCPKCGKAMDVRKIRDGGHMCGKKCPTCGVDLDSKDTDHLCYVQQLECEEESSYNHLLFFDFEATQEHGIHHPNLCVVYDEEKEVALFQGQDTVKEFCQWLLTPEHKGCIVVAHNFQGYDSYFIIKFLNENAIHYEIIYRGAKCLSMTIPMFNIKFIDSLNFIPMGLAKFPKTFAQPELCKGYFPHLFNKDENQNYVGPIPCQDDYGVNFMKPAEREAFIAWHQEQVENNYVFDFRKEIIKYCRSDVDILAKCCLLYREMFKDITGIDPFDKALTIASYCHQVYRTKFLKEDTIAIFSHARQLKANQSAEAIKWLSYTAEKEDIHIQHVRNGGESRVGNYSLDGYCEETHTAYEFQGCFWHGKDLCDFKHTKYGKNMNVFFPFLGCPECYKKRGIVNPINQKTMEQLYKDTLRKVKYLKDLGFEVEQKWGCELTKELEQDGEMKQFFEDHELVDPLQPRDAFYGGRTNAAKLFHQCQDNEKIK